MGPATMILGHLDSIQKSTAIGWAINRNVEESPLSVLIKVNDETAAYGDTFQMRPDIVKLYGQRFAGFCIPIPEFYFDANVPLKIEAFVGETKLAGSVIVPPKTFFLHIPKTGGSSLRSALEPLYENHLIYPDAYQLQRNAGNYPPLVGPKFNYSKIDRR